MGGTRSSHLPLDRKSVLNIISLRSSMPAGCGTRDALAEIAGGFFFAHSLSFSKCFGIHFHRLTVFITAHFAFRLFYIIFFYSFFLHFWRMAIGRRRERMRRRRRRQLSARRGESICTVIRVCGLQCVCSTNDDRALVLASAAASALGKQLTNWLPSPLLCFAVRCSLCRWWWVKVGAHTQTRARAILLLT